MHKETRAGETNLNQNAICSVPYIIATDNNNNDREDNEKIKKGLGAAMTSSQQEAICRTHPATMDVKGMIIKCLSAGCVPL